MLRHCLAPSLRRQLNELPKSLDETYERVLKEIESTNQGRHARRLLQCLAVAMRPLRVKELAEVLAFDLDGAKAEIPTFHAEWRWEDQEQAVLSACSSLISIVGGDSDHSRVVQFSHFSVKEYLTSERLATTSGDLSQYYIDSEPAHLILAQACLGVLLTLDNRIVKESEEGSTKNIPLLLYSASHWVSHAQVGNVSTRLKDAMGTLFDLDKPYFLEWKQIYDNYPYTLCDDDYSPTNPLYYAVLCGFYDLTQCLVSKFPDQVNHDGHRYNSPLAAALFRNHVRIADLLVEHGAHAHVRGNPPLCYAVQFSDDARVDAVQFLLRHGAHVNAGLESLETPLHLAADVGDPEVARILLEHGADVDIQDDNGRVPLHLVSTGERESRRDEGGERSITARLLVEHGADVNARDKGGATPLHFASRHWRFEIAQLLLDNGANANTSDVQGRNPLHELLKGSPSSYAAMSQESLRGLKLQNALSIAKLLLKHSVDLNALDKAYDTPLHFASDGTLEVARLLLDHGAKANAENVRGETPLHQASKRENPNIARLLLELGVDVDPRDKNWATPLHFACSFGNFETILVLLDHGAEVDAQNVDGQTPLHRVLDQAFSLSIDPDNRGVARLMLERGADVNARDKDQATPLHFACNASMFKIAQVLLDHGAEADARNAKGQTPLHLVSHTRISYGQISDDSPIARLLLERGVNVNARDNDQETPLHAACSYGVTGSAVVLLDHGAEVSTQNADGQTPLHRVFQDMYPGPFSRPHDLVARPLLERGVDVNARNKHQETPLHLASDRPFLDTVQVLLDHGADTDARDVDSQTPLHRLSKCSHYVYPPVVRLFLERGMDVNAREREQATPLHLASYYGLAEVAEVLLDHEAQANAVDIRGQTPLHKVLLGNHNYLHRWAPLKSAVRLVQQLLEHGADVNALDKDHETPLHLASRLRLHEMARVLLKHGADVNVKNCKGRSPLELATRRKGKAMRRLLLEYSAE
ncbi:ankyrin repeat-containing domain protein [Lactarius vividus]|nr:ankyrin repeat-containing domain protein [Lactarius vividus]